LAVFDDAHAEADDAAAPMVDLALLAVGDDDDDFENFDVIDFSLCDDSALCDDAVPPPAASPRTVLLAVCDDVALAAVDVGYAARASVVDLGCAARASMPAGLLSSAHFDIPQRLSRAGEARPRRRPPPSDLPDAKADANAKNAWKAWRVKKTVDDDIDIDFDVVSPPRHQADRRASHSSNAAPDAAARAAITTPPWDRARSRNGDDSACPPRRITYLTLADEDDDAAPWRPAESETPNVEQRTPAEDQAHAVLAKLLFEASDYANEKENLRLTA
jgi:hypothetical protein